MNKEEEYKSTLMHTIKWIDGDGFLDRYKPVSADLANRVANVIKGVVYENMTLKDSIDKYGNN
jgi:hypothetical protein